MSGQHSQEVQLLLAAEKRASEKVAEARKRKVLRLRQAKEEAAAEIELFKTERQRAFAEYEQEHMGSRGDIEKKIEQETTQKLGEMSNRVETTKNVILERLIEEVVTNVDAQLHHNFKKTIAA